MENVNTHLKKLLKDPYFKELYELEQQKLEVAHILIKYRIKHSLTQKELAKKMGVTQQYISKVESGDFSNLKAVMILLFLIGFKVKLDIKPIAKQFRIKISPTVRAKLKRELKAA